MRSPLFPTACCILFATALLAGCGESPHPDTPYSATIAEGRAAVKEIMAETGATSISVALVDGDRVVWSEAFGVVDQKSGREATTATLFAACSVSKMLATVATMILVD